MRNFDLKKLFSLFAVKIKYTHIDLTRLSKTESFENFLNL